jgi:hypothetical protein
MRLHVHGLSGDCGGRQVLTDHRSKVKLYGAPSEH